MAEILDGIYSANEDGVWQLISGPASTRAHLATLADLLREVAVSENPSTAIDAVALHDAGVGQRLKSAWQAVHRKKGAKVAAKVVGFLALIYLEQVAEEMLEPAVVATIETAHNLPGEVRDLTGDLYDGLDPQAPPHPIEEVMQLPTDTPPPDPTQHSRETVRLAGLVTEGNILESHTFRDCEIVGPSVVFLEENVSITHCVFDVPDAESMLWRLDDRPVQVIIGAIRLIDCVFEGCTFLDIGFTGHDEVLDALVGSN